MHLAPGTNVHVAPEDLTGDDGFRNIGMVTRVISSTEQGDSDTYYEIWDAETGELYSCREDQVSATTRQDDTPDAARLAEVVIQAGKKGWRIEPVSDAVFKAVQRRDGADRTIANAIRGIDELEAFTIH
jgi:hypothetical protein